MTGEPCPACGKDSGIEFGFEQLLRDDLSCAACGAALRIDYDESMVNGEEIMHWSLQCRG